ncbi:MAG: TonB-dependent receptor, partial [Phenylobacterium sp.]
AAAESGARSSFPGFSNFVPPAAFQLQHGGLTSAGNNNPYAQAYSAGQGVAGNPALEPETSRSFTFGVIAQPFSWLSATVDYYKVKKEGLIVNGPLGGAARTAYYSQSTSAAGCAAVAAVGTGYSCNLLDSVDPLFPTAMQRVLIINVPFVNANALEDQGLDFSATGVFDLPYDIKWTSKVETTYVIQHDLVTSAGVQKYAGTLGPYELSSGNGTPKIRGNWQNTLEMGRYTLSATAYYVHKIKAVATDEGNLATDCSAALYVGPSGDTNQFCYVKRFISVDLNGSAEIREGLKLYANIGNVFDAKAPIDPAGYTSSPNFMTTWHYAGVIGRTYKVGVKFEF